MGLADMAAARGSQAAAREATEGDALARSMIVLKALDGDNTIEQDVKVVVTREQDVKIQDGDEVVCLVVGRARVYGGGHEVMIEAARLAQVVEVRKPKRPKPPSTQHMTCAMIVLCVGRSKRRW